LKVKKIEWEKTVIGLHATLPMQLHARISKQGELYKWAIMRGTLSIVTYFTKSEEQAKKDCQKAWEDMVMEAFEKKEPCEYCDNTHKELPQEDGEGGLYLCADEVFVKTYDNTLENESLKPCPFCGGQPEIKEVGNAFSVFHTCRAMYGNDDGVVRMKIESRLFGSRSSAIKYWNRRS